MSKHIICHPQPNVIANSHYPNRIPTPVKLVIIPPPPVTHLPQYFPRISISEVHPVNSEPTEDILSLSWHLVSSVMIVSWDCWACGGCNHCNQGYYRHCPTVCFPPLASLVLASCHAYSGPRSMPGRTVCRHPVGVDQAPASLMQHRLTQPLTASHSSDSPPVSPACSVTRLSGLGRSRLNL